MKKFIIMLIIAVVIFIVVGIWYYSHLKDNVLDGDGMIYESISEIELVVNDKVFTISLTDNSATRELVEKLKKDNIVVSMDDYGGFEKVGSLGFDLFTGDETITTVPGDVILYQGNQLVIFYGSNTWSYTKLGHILHASESDLKSALGDGKVEVILRIGSRK